MAVLVQQPQGEILGMGGPWLGELQWQGHQLPGYYLMQPEVVDSGGQYAVVVQTNQPDVAARNQVAFWLTVLRLADGMLFRSPETWPALYAADFSGNSIGFYPLFHPGQPGQKQQLNFSEDQFQQLARLA